MISKKDGFLGARQVVLPPVLIEAQEHDALCRSLYITDIGYYPRAEHHHRVRQKGSTQYVLIYCVDGAGFYVVDGQRYVVRPNQYFILPIGRRHEYGAMDGCDWTIYWVHFAGECAHVYADGAVTPQSINVTLNSRIVDRINIFEEMLTTLNTGHGIEDLRYASSLLHHFLASMRYLGQFRRAKSVTTSETVMQGDGGAIDIVEQAIHYMKENIEHRVTMQDVLRYVGYSQSHFSTLFKRRMGQSPLAYFNVLKIEHACDLLAHTDMKINMICYKVGIEDALYFSRLFSKIKGVSPSEFRRRRGN